MPGCVWDFSFRVNQGTKTSLTDGTVTVSYFDNVTRRALWWFETLKRQNVLLNNPRNAQSSLSQLANYHWNISFFMKLSLEGASEMLQPEKKWANYSKDSSNNEQEPLIKMIITWNSLIISFVSLWLPLSVFERLWREEGDVVSVNKRLKTLAGFTEAVRGILPLLWFQFLFIISFS